MVKRYYMWTKKKKYNHKITAQESHKRDVTNSTWLIDQNNVDIGNQTTQKRKDNHIRVR